MGRRFSGNGAGGASPPRAITASQQVPLQGGSLFTLGAPGLLQPAVFSKTGGNANLTINAASGAVTAAAALATGASQAITGTIVGADGVSFPFSVTLTGAAVTGASAPAAPAFSAVAGAGQVTLGWTDGSDGGSAITAHKLYRGTTAGGEALLGTSTGASPYVDSGLTNGQAYFYRLSAMNAVGESALAAEQSATPAAVTGTPLPQQAALVARWSADAVPAQADNTAIASWTDSINAVAAAQATAAKQPKYRTARLGGRPSVQFSGGAYLTIPRASAPAMVGAVDSKMRTIVVIASNIGTATNGWLFGANTTGSNGPFLTATGTRVGTFGSSTVGNGNTIPFSGTGLCVVGEAATGPGTGVSQMVEMYVNGTRPYQHTAAPLTSGTADFSIGARATDGGLPGVFDCYEVLVWNVALTPADMTRLMSWACAKYGVTDPLASITTFQVFDGDSLTVGQNASAPEFSYPYLVAQAMNLSLGQWTCTAIKGVTMASLTTVQASRVTALGAATGKRLSVAVGEWYNQAAPAPAPANNTRAYLAQLKTALPGARTVLWTSTANGGEGTSTQRPDYNAAFDADHATNIDGYIPVHTDANIGVMGATANADASTYFETGRIHLTGTAGTCGYRNLSTMALPVIQAVYNA